MVMQVIMIVIVIIHIVQYEMQFNEVLNVFPQQGKRKH